MHLASIGMVEKIKKMMHLRRWVSLLSKKNNNNKDKKMSEFTRMIEFAM